MPIEDANKKREREAAARKADKYCDKEGGPPDAPEVRETLSGLDFVEYGKRVIAKFHAILMSGIAQVEFFDVDVTPVHDDLAFVEFRSRATTTKGQPYGNRYIARCDARGGKILHWREFFDPRPAELVRANHAENLAGRNG